MGQLKELLREGFRLPHEMTRDPLHRPPEDIDIFTGSKKGSNHHE
jgi:hypothetical protein